MKRMQMLQDLKTIATQSEEHTNCTEANILTKHHDMQQFFAQNTAIRDYHEFVHFLGHLLIECYELGYQRKCKDMEEAELITLFNQPTK
jgi:hypothetical protein